VVGRNPHRRWVLDADLAAAFDRIGHTQLLALLGAFPARDRIAEWLRAGVVEREQLTPTLAGTPQGGVICRPSRNSLVRGRCLSRNSLLAVT
jgi:RNA-directed DNA polymerase